MFGAFLMWHSRAIRNHRLEDGIVTHDNYTATKNYVTLY